MTAATLHPPRGALASILRYSDLATALTVVLVVVMMITPIPTQLLDIFIAINIAGALMIVVVSMYTKEALEFSAFPSVLLFTTLFRLAINVSVTRMILTHGDAGSVVESFGHFVVGGNVVVGIVVFLIIVVIQFVVITQGAGRVAEVAARFTLDAMPGKQMAIDADLNAGQITDDQARERRLKIQHEADFYGAMDGASKFVRGDAIAGVIIVVVNLLAGITVGVVQQGMEFSEAVSTFTLLTVGDGLAAQIPALLISTATGIVVTRAAGENDLGHDIAGQLLARSKPLFICGGVLIGLGLVPGLPHIPFLLIGGALVTVGIFVRNNQRDVSAFAVEEDRRQLEAAKPIAGSPESVRSALALDTLELEIGYGLISLVDESDGGELLTRVSLVRRQMAQDLGLVLAPIRIRDNVQLGSHAYAVKIRGAEIARGELLPGSLLAMNPGDADPSLDGVPTTEPAFGLPALWISQAARERAEAAGYTVVDPASIIITHLTEVVRQHAGELISLQDVKLLVDGLRERMPAVVDEATPELLSLGEVHRVLAALLTEGVSIRDLATILEMLSDKARITKDTALLAEYARQALARQITQEMLGPGGELSVITLDSGFEHEVTESIVQTPDGTYLGLDPGRAAAMCDGVRIQVEQAAKLGVRPALLCSARLRRHLKALTAHAVPRLVVLSYNEIVPSVRVETVGVVHAEAAAAA